MNNQKVQTKKYYAIMIVVFFAVVIFMSLILSQHTSLEYNYAHGTIVKSRVDNAQYLPNINLLANETSQSQLLSATTNQTDIISDLSFTLEDYQEIVGDLAIITGTAIRNDTSILDIKQEIYTVLNMVPLFNTWFQLPKYFEAEHAQDGYNNYYYNFSYDSDLQEITVTRMTTSYTCSLYDSENDQVFSTYYDDNLKQYQLMQTKYYFNDDLKEVVECSVVDFAVFDNNFYPIQCQYLSNVKDTSTTKIQIVLKKEVNLYEDKITNNANGNVDSGLDIDTINESGVMKKIVQLNYVDSDNVELIKIEQNMHTDYYSNIDTTNLAYYFKQSENAIYFTDSWDYFDSENSKDDIPLNNIFNINSSSIDKNLIIDSFKSSQYATRQVMGTFNSSSSTVCTDCYNNVIDSGILAYKCNHNKNLQSVARATRRIIGTSEDFINTETKFLSWKLAKHLEKFTQNLISEPELISSNISDLCIDMSDNLLFEYNLDTYVNSIAKDYINNASILNNLEDTFNTITFEALSLYKNQLLDNALSKELELQNLSQTANITDGIITINASAFLNADILIEKDKYYSLGLVLFDNDNHIAYTLLSNYLEFKDDNLLLTLDGTYDLTTFTLLPKDLKINKSINLTLGYALLKESSQKDIICSAYIPTILSSCTFNQFEYEDLGFVLNYIPQCNNNVLTIQITAEDIQQPYFEIESMYDNSVAFAPGSKYSDLLAVIKLFDNDTVKSFAIMFNDEEYTSFNQELQAGTHTIILTDRSGNYFEYELNILITVTE